MADWYAPNQQAVRGDQSGPAEEGQGKSKRVDGSGGEGRAEGMVAVNPDQVGTATDGPTKAELLAKAQEMGASPANNAMTKAELEASIAAREAELAEEGNA